MRPAGGTTTKAIICLYEVPEVYESEHQNESRVRIYDIWSLGCVFLEIVIWLLYNSKVLTNFENNKQDLYANP